MKIALACPYAWDRFGGVQTHVRALAGELRRRDHEVVVLAPGAGHHPPGPGVVLTGRALPVPANGSVAPLAFGPLTAAAVRRALRAFGPDVLHVHEPLIPSVSLIALWNARCPVVGTFHAAAGSSVGYRLARPILERAARKLKFRTAVSNAAKALAGTYFPGDFLITPNGVDLERFERATALVPTDRGRSVLFFSRIEKRKGLTVLMDAVAKLDDPTIELVIGGAGPGEKDARSRASSARINARFVGRVDEENVPGLFRSATVFCAPGLGGESFGIVLIEAMAAGAPVVCSDLPGFREVAAGAAVLVPPGDADALAAVLRRLLDSPRDRDEMSERSRRRAKLYEWSRLVHYVEHIYGMAVG